MSVFLTILCLIVKCIICFFGAPIFFFFFSFIQDLKYEENSVKAVQCLNDMVTNALLHADDCLQYMSALRDSSNFRFCAIPQVLFFYLIIYLLLNCHVDRVTHAML